MRSGRAPRAAIASIGGERDPGGRTDASGVGSGYHTGDRVAGEDRDAVGDQHRQRNAALGRDDPVDSRWHGLADDHGSHQPGMRLAHEHQALGGNPRSFRHGRPIRRDGRRVVADAPTEVQRGVRRRR